MSQSTPTVANTDLIAASLAATQSVIAAMAGDAALHENVRRAADLCLASLHGGGRILLAGNGGSAGDSQHIAAELVGRFAFNRPALAGIALTTDTSALTAIANDYGYEAGFSRQLEALGRPGDVFIGLSTSGNSPNVVKACEQARAMGLGCIGMTGAGGGAIAKLCDVLLAMPSTSTRHIQEGHISVGHIICDLIEQTLFEKK